MAALSVVPTASGHGPPEALFVAGPNPPELPPVMLPLMGAPQSRLLNCASIGEQLTPVNTVELPEATEQDAVLA